MAISLIASANYGGAGGGFTGGASLDSTGADFLVAAIARYQGATLTDSKSNTWTLLSTYAAGGDPTTELYYCIPTSVGSGHTFSYSGSNAFSSIAVAAFSGVKQTSPQDGSTTTNTGSGLTSIQPGSITPSVDGGLWVSALGINNCGSVPASTFAGVTSRRDHLNSVGGYDDNYGVGLTWEIQTTATASNPTWSWASGSTPGAIGAVFFAAGGGGGGTGQPTMRRWGGVPRMRLGGSGGSSWG